MKAEQGNIISKDRHKLEEVLPLNTPYSIVIDPSNLCNFKCDFCAIQTSKDIVSYKKHAMPFDLFTKIINDIDKFEEKIKVLRINGQGEPLLNKNFCKMVKYAKEADVAKWIETITNGSMLNPKLNQELVDSGIDRIRISIEAIDDEGYKNIANVNMDIKVLVDNIADLYKRSRGKTEIYIKTVDASVDTESKKELFYTMFGDICDKIFIDNVIPMWSDFEKINEAYNFEKKLGVHGQEIRNVEICPYPFYSFIINSDGEITVCCADWKRKIVIGDAKKESVVDIWKGKTYQSFLKDMLVKKRNNFEMCRKCLLPMYDCNDNIDMYGEELSKKY